MAASVDQRRLDAITPVVLVGGRSSRFGGDKLRLPLGSSGAFQPVPHGRGGSGGVLADGAAMLVDLPITALRGVFGARVARVGECHPGVAARFDVALPDRWPGIGPLGGVASALFETAGDVFVLPGDAPNFDAAAVRELLCAAQGPPACATDAPVAFLACMAGGATEGAGFEPCIGVYTMAALPHLLAAIDRAAEHPAHPGALALHRALPGHAVVRVPFAASLLVNVNSPDDAAGLAPAAGALRGGRA